MFLLFFLTLFFSPYLAIAKFDCSGTYRNVYGDGEVELIWYPRAWHVELGVDKKSYNMIGGTQKPRSLDTLHFFASSGTSLSLVRFKIRTSDKEFSNLLKYMDSTEGKFALQSCISGVCKALRKNTGLNIPPPFRYTPTLSMLYLTLAKKLGYKRIEKIEVLGKRDGLLGDGLA